MWGRIMTFINAVSDCVHRCVHVGGNDDIHQCCSEDQWHLLPWHVSDSTAVTCNAWDLCRILYLPTMQCWNDRYQSCFHFTTSLAPNNTDLNPLDYKTWGEMQQQVYQVHDVDELKQRLINVWHRFEQSVINDAGGMVSSANSSVWIFVWKKAILSI